MGVFFFTACLLNQKRAVIQDEQNRNILSETGMAVNWGNVSPKPRGGVSSFWFLLEEKEQSTLFYLCGPPAQLSFSALLSLVIYFIHCSEMRFFSVQVLCVLDVKLILLPWEPSVFTLRYHHGITVHFYIMWYLVTRGALPQFFLITRVYCTISIGILIYIKHQISVVFLFPQDTFALQALHVIVIQCVTWIIKACVPLKRLQCACVWHLGVRFIESCRSSDKHTSTDKIVQRRTRCHGRWSENNQFRGGGKKSVEERRVHKTTQEKNKWQVFE